MPETDRSIFRTLAVMGMLILVACSSNNPPPDESGSALPTGSSSPQVTLTPSPTPEPRILTICLGQEPASLFLYGDNSNAARSIRQAIYDGPLDRVNYQLQPVILQNVPSLADGAALQPVQVNSGEWIIDSNGSLVTLAEGVSYLPSGCSDPSCQALYAGRDPVGMDQLVVRYQLLPGLTWSDGAPLTADDSLYSFEIAQSLYPAARASLIERTAAYTAIDDASIEWRGIPGYKDPAYAENLFTPLPRHAWGEIPAQELAASPQAGQAPLGWGAYVVDAWAPGKQISFYPNLNYFRQPDGLPFFDQLIFRFLPDAQQAVSELQTGGCDVLDESLNLDSQLDMLQELQAAGQAALVIKGGTAWEHADFGITAYNPDPLQPALFQSKLTRQAVALCVDRQKLASEQQQIIDSFSPPGHPLTSASVRQYAFDPQAAASLLDSAGWLDADGSPATARISLGVLGVPDGTPFAFTYLVSDETQAVQAAESIRTGLAACGIQVEVSSLPASELFAPGPDGPLFGRKFAMAQYAWPTSPEPSCFLYTTSEIPGPYPEYPLGWGGSNASGFSSLDYDLACLQARSTLIDQPEHANAHFQAQSLFAEQLPSLPLYLHSTYLASRADLCGLLVDASNISQFWNIENFAAGEACAN